MKIAVAGTGYVGLSNAVILAQHHDVVALDVDEAKVALINQRRSPLVDPELEEYLSGHELSLRATLDESEAYPGAAFVVVATPTDYDERSHFFDTSTVEHVIARVQAIEPNAVVVVKSTVPVGFTERMRAEHPGLRIVFSTEFLREGRAL